MKVLVDQLAITSNGSNHGVAEFGGFNPSDGSFIVDDTVRFSLVGINTSIDFKNAVVTAILAYAVANSYTLTADDILWCPVPDAIAYNNAPARSIVTGTGAVGFQPSATRDTLVSYSPKIVTTATIAGGADGYVVLEIASTNSATAGDWKEIGRMENGQALSLALTLQSVQPMGAPLAGIVPAGWYAKLRSVNVTGTPTFSSVSGQEVQLF